MISLKRTPKKQLVAHFKDSLHRVCSIWASQAPAGPFLIVNTNGYTFQLRQDIVALLVPYIRQFALTGDIEEKTRIPRLPTAEEIAQVISNAGWERSGGVVEQPPYDENDLFLAKRVHEFIQARS